jgi:hypothetical protein
VVARRALAARVWQGLPQYTWGLPRRGPGVNEVAQWAQLRVALTGALFLVDGGNLPALVGEEALMFGEGWWKPLAGERGDLRSGTQGIDLHAPLEFILVGTTRATSRSGSR